MPPHHHYCDWWWEDLPESARKAATVLGYSQETWDADEDVPYDHQSFAECTRNEKAAALFLGMPPLEDKLDVWWSEVDPETQKHAEALTYTQQFWDEDYYLEDLPCDAWYWKDMNEEQKAAARHFGYTPSTWDETGEDVFETADGADVEVPAGKKDEKKEEGGKKTGGGRKKQDKKKKDQGKYKVSRFLGGESGALFDHRNHRFIESIEVFTGGKIIDGLKVTYCNHAIHNAGTCSGKSEKFTLEKGEYIEKVEVRSDQVVQELTFHTNKGKQHGPFGGHGRMLKDKKGGVHNLHAPRRDMCLCGFLGRQSKLIDALALRWGPTDTVPAE